MLNNLTVAYHTATLFGYGSYKLTPNIQASLQLNYGKSWSENNSVPAVKLGNQTIQADNAYLDPTIAARMTTLGITSFSFGSINTNNLTPADFNDLSLKKEAQTFGVPVAITQRQLMRGVFTLQGSLGDDWSWNTYYQHGTVRVHLHVLNNVINQNYSNAVDAVRVTTGNVGIVRSGGRLHRLPFDPDQSDQWLPALGRVRRRRRVAGRDQLRHHQERLRDHCPERRRGGGFDAGRAALVAAGRSGRGVVRRRISQGRRPHHRRSRRRRGPVFGRQLQQLRRPVQCRWKASSKSRRRSSRTISSRT